MNYPRPNHAQLFACLRACWYPPSPPTVIMLQARTWASKSYQSTDQSSWGRRRFASGGARAEPRHNQSIFQRAPQAEKPADNNNAEYTAVMWKAHNASILRRVAKRVSLDPEILSSGLPIWHVPKSEDCDDASGAMRESSCSVRVKGFRRVLRINLSLMAQIVVLKISFQQRDRSLGERSHQRNSVPRGHASQCSWSLGKPTAIKQHEWLLPTHDFSLRTTTKVEVVRNNNVGSQGKLVS